MHILLEKLLKKRNIEKVDDLSKEEKVWFDDKQRILSQPDEITIEDFQTFCKGQIEGIEGQFKNLDNSSKKNERLILLHNAYSTILKATTASKDERVLLEDHLQQLIN